MTAPAWVRKRDGTLVPFDPDEISRALFAAGESVGRPDAFLARELADGVVHFLASEAGDATPATSQVAEIVVKVVRELGQPALAQAFADEAWARARHGQPADATPPKLESSELAVPFSPGATREELVASCLRGFALQAVFARDLAAAHRDGLLTLQELDAPFELAGCVLNSAPSVLEAVEQARGQAAGLVAIDGPEYALTARPEELPAYVRELRAVLRCAGLGAVVNLNCATAPTWADDVGSGPLFAGQSSASAGGRLEVSSDSLLEALLSATPRAAAAVQIDWHLGENDFRPEAASRLLALARRAADGAALSFAFDRPRRPITVAAGMDRQNPAILLTVLLNLPALAAQVARQADAPARFLQKLGSLVRLALSAGVQKRDFLRRRRPDRSGLARGFLLDRARLVVAPVGLYPVVATLIGRAPEDTPEALEFARRIVGRLGDVVDEDSRTRHLEVALDGSWLACSEVEYRNARQPAEVKSQLRVAAALHDAAPLGTFTLLVDADVSPPPEEIAESLRWLWKRSAVARFRLARRAPSPRQLTIDA